MSKLPALFKELMKPLKMMEQQMKMMQQQMKITDDFYRPKFKLDFLDKNEILHEKDRIRVKVTIPEFKPEEISVKTVNGNAIQVEARQREDINNKSYIGKYYLRRFVVPYGTDLKRVSSSLSDEGVLTITAPRSVQDFEEKNVPVQIGPSRIE